MYILVASTFLILWIVYKAADIICTLKNKQLYLHLNFNKDKGYCLQKMVQSLWKIIFAEPSNFKYSDKWASDSNLIYEYEYPNKFKTFLHNDSTH